MTILPKRNLSLAYQELASINSTVCSSLLPGTLQFAMLNVVGVKSKIICPEFNNFIREFDAIGLQETQIDDLDHVAFHKYDIHFNNRYSIVTSMKSGGIALLANKRVSNSITVFQWNRNLLCGLASLNH